MDPASDIWNGQSELTISPGHVLVLHMWRRGLNSVLSRFFYILSAIYP